MTLMKLEISTGSHTVDTESTIICGHGPTQRDQMKPGSDEKGFDIKPRSLSVKTI